MIVSPTECALNLYLNIFLVAIYLLRHATPNVFDTPSALPNVDFVEYIVI